MLDLSSVGIMPLRKFGLFLHMYGSPASGVCVKIHKKYLCNVNQRKLLPSTDQWCCLPCLLSDNNAAEGNMCTISKSFYAMAMVSSWLTWGRGWCRCRHWHGHGHCRGSRSSAWTWLARHWLLAGLLGEVVQWACKLYWSSDHFLHRMLHLNQALPGSL